MTRASDSDYLKYFERMRIDQLAERLEAEGYDVQREAPVDGMRADLLARRQGRTVVVEVKMRSALGAETVHVTRLREICQRRGWEFRLVVGELPRRVEVEVDELADSLRRYLWLNPPSEVHETTGRGEVEDIVDIDIDLVRVFKDRVEVGGNAALDVVLTMGGSREDDSESWRGTLSLSFLVVLNRELEVIDAKKLAVDTRPFFGRPDE